MIMCLKQLQEVVNCSMWSAASMICSGAMGEVGGMMVRRAVSPITSRFEMHEGHDEIMNSLQQEVIKFQCAIETARGRRLTNNNQKLLEWLAQIISAAYHGDYYLRTFQSQTSLPPMIASAQGMSNLFCNYPTNRATKRQRTMRTFLFGNDEYREVHDVLKKLRSFDMVSFLLMVNAQPERPMKRYLYMEPTTRLIYRAKEREQVMKFLLEPNMATENNVDILPIVGSRGAGKTTLALHCFYDAKVQNHFSLKIYISHSHIGYAPKYKPPGPPLIFNCVLKQLNCTDIRNFDENTLLAMLKQNLSSEKFLIVIDSVWDHPDSMVWNALLGCLRCGKHGSKIIFTCNNLIVYNKIKNYETWQPILLDSFPEDEYMLFFMEHAFGSADPEDFPDLANLGGEIAKNLDGSIWGAKIIGELLRDNLNAPFWSIVSRVGFLRSKFHGNKNICPVLKTIFQLLPKRLCLTRMIMAMADEQWVLEGYNRVKSFRELMVLGPKYCTPNTKIGKNDELMFLVTKHFDRHKSIAFFAVCKEPPVG